MNKEDIRINDITRILLGDMPPEFMIEVVIRVLVVYILLISTMRILGLRMEAMISRNEEIVLVTLAASVGILIHNPDRGLLPAIIVVVVVVGIQYLNNWIMRRSPRFEKMLLDEPQTLVDNGRFKLENMRQTRIQRERMVSELRSRKLINLAEVQRAYIEANGQFTIMTFEEKKERTGLCLLPDTDTDFRNEQRYSPDTYACKVCGNLAPENAKKCKECDSNNWEKAVVTD
ncbi:MAG: DUF421 domain-containing protein [Flavobacterium sp.]|nr:MAG: DUF421 domain-containing protein [Flavobacterium sp.]